VAAVWGVAIGVSQLFDHPEFAGQPWTGRLTDAVFLSVWIGVGVPSLVLALGGMAGPAGQLLREERTQVDRMIRECRPGEDAELRSIAVAICRYRLRTANAPIIFAVPAAMALGAAVWEYVSRDYGTAVLMTVAVVVLLALVPRLIRSTGQTRTRLRAFLAAAEDAPTTH
jgi:hypothetical protein